MYKKAKVCMIPCKENDHEPHILRKFGIKLLLSLVIALELGFLFLLSPIFPGKLDYLAAVLPSVLVASTNDTREDLSLPELSTNPKLVQAAQLKVNDMATRGYFSHNTPEGQAPWYFLNLVGYEYDAAGENLAVNFVDSRDVHRAWMKSPTHRQNIVQEKFTEIGIATAEGKYQGKNVIFVAQFFGTPQPAPVIGDNIGAIAQIDTEPEEVVVEEVEIAQEVLGEEVVEVAFVETHPNLTLIEKFTAMPRSVATTLMSILGFLVMVSIFVLVSMKLHLKKQSVIMHGILLAVVIASLIFVNQELVEYFGDIA